MVQNQLAENILDYNRFHEMMFSLMPDNVRDNVDAEDLVIDGMIFKINGQEHMTQQLYQV